MSARDIDHAEQLFGRIRGVLERAKWGTKAERTNVAWAILDEILQTPTQPPRLALARALVRECAVVPREPTREMWEAAGNGLVNGRVKIRAHHDYISGTVWTAMLAAAGDTP